MGWCAGNRRCGCLFRGVGDRGEKSALLLARASGHPGPSGEITPPCAAPPASPSRARLPWRPCPAPCRRSAAAFRAGPRRSSCPSSPRPWQPFGSGGLALGGRRALSAFHRAAQRVHQVDHVARRLGRLLGRHRDAGRFLLQHLDHRILVLIDERGRDRTRPPWSPGCARRAAASPSKSSGPGSRRNTPPPAAPRRHSAAWFPSAPSPRAAA